MKKLFKILGILLLLLVFAGIGFYLFGTADLRTQTAKQDPQPEKAKSLLMEMAAAHKISQWDNIQTYAVSFEDEFYGFMGKSGNPFPEMRTRFELQYIPKTFDGTLSILDGPWSGKTWGIQSWKTYKPQKNDEVVFKADKNIQFWLPTYQYFIEFPVRILQANTFAYAGEATIKGKKCDGVMASWNTISPQRDIDQYLIWIDSESKRIVKLEYTIREMFHFLTGAAYFTEYKDFDGILLPTVMPVESNLVRKGLLHEMRIMDFRKNPVPTSRLRPDPQLTKFRDEKPQ